MSGVVMLADLPVFGPLQATHRSYVDATIDWKIAAIPAPVIPDGPGGVLLWTQPAEVTQSFSTTNRLTLDVNVTPNRPGVRLVEVKVQAHARDSGNELVTGTCLIGENPVQTTKAFVFVQDADQVTNAFRATWLGRVSGPTRVQVWFRAPRAPGWVGHDSSQFGPYGVDYTVTDVGPAPS